MRRTILLATGWVATAALAVTMTALVLSNGNDGAAGGALTEDQVTKRLAASGTPDTSAPAANPVGSAAQAAPGTPIVTKGGTLSVRCNPTQPHVMEHVTRVTKPGWRIENWSDGLANSVALAHKLPNRVVTVISNSRFPGRYTVAFRERILAPERGWVKVLVGPGVGETIVVLSWCENGKPKWVLNDK